MQAGRKAGKWAGPNEAEDSDQTPQPLPAAREQVSLHGMIAARTAKMAEHPAAMIDSAMRRTAARSSARAPPGSFRSGVTMGGTMPAAHAWR